VTKDVIAKTLVRPNISGRFYGRNPADSSGPTAPTQLQAVPRDTSIDIQWINGVDPDTGISGTLVQWRRNGAIPWSSATVPYLGTSPLSSTYTISGLTAATAYDIQVTNSNNAVPPVPSAPTNVTVSTIASDPATAPGTITLAATQISIPENSQVGITLIRSGAGASSQSVQAQFAFSGFSSGTPSPGNAPLDWAAGENGPKTFQVTAGSVAQNVSGVLNIVSATSPSGLQPSIGTPSQAAVTVINLPSTGKNWNPGYYGHSQQRTYSDDRTRAAQVADLNLIGNGGPNVQGIKIDYYSAALAGPTPGTYDFTKVVRDLNIMRSYGKRLMITVEPQDFNGGSNYANLLPSYILSDSTYGASPVAGKYGFWTANGGTETTAAFWRIKMMDWYIALFQAMATTVNPTTGLMLKDDPFIEQLSFGETSIGIDAGSDYVPSSTQMVVQYKRLMDAVVAAWPKTLFMVNNNFCGNQANSQALTDYCLQTGCALGGPDTFAVGQKGPGPYDGLTWGQRAVLGSLVGDPNFTGPDLRGQIVMMSDTQGPEISSTRYTIYTPHTFYGIVNNLLRQAHMVITMVNTGFSDDPIPAYPADGPNSGAHPGNWHSMLQVINGNPLTHVAKPSSIS